MKALRSYISIISYLNELVKKNNKLYKNFTLNQTQAHNRFNFAIKVTRCLYSTLTKFSLWIQEEKLKWKIQIIFFLNIYIALSFIVQLQCNFLFNIYKFVVCSTSQEFVGYSNFLSKENKVYFSKLKEKFLYFLQRYKINFLRVSYLTLTFYFLIFLLNLLYIACLNFRLKDTWFNMLYIFFCVGFLRANSHCWTVMNYVAIILQTT